jgi:putative DNA primase/helicase
VGIDLDDCVDAEGQPNERAAALIREFSSYTERTPSGKGFRILIEGTKPKGAGCRKNSVVGGGGIEIYERGRYFTFTGDRTDGTPATIEARQEALDELCAKLWPPPPARPATTPSAYVAVADDRTLLDKARQAKNGAKFVALFDCGNTGGRGGDDSAADLALCNLLSFWCRGDDARIDRLFRQSALMRPKWDEPRGDRTYGAMTVDKAIAESSRTFGSSQKSGTIHAGGVTKPDGDEIPLGSNPGQRDPETGRLILSQKRTLPTAEVFVRQH